MYLIALIKELQYEIFNFFYLVIFPWQHCFVVSKLSFLNASLFRSIKDLLQVFYWKNLIVQKMNISNTFVLLEIDKRMFYVQRSSL